MAARRHVLLSLALLAVPTAASANWLEGGAAPPPPVAVASTPASQVLRVATAVPRGKIDTADPWTARANTLAPPLRLPLDTTDPWGSRPLAAPEALVTRRNRSLSDGEAWGAEAPWSARRPLPLDVTDPWTPNPATRPAPSANGRSAASVKGARARADDALRNAIKAAIDAGDLDRASSLIDVLRGQGRSSKPPVDP